MCALTRTGLVGLLTATFATATASQLLGPLKNFPRTLRVLGLGLLDLVLLLVVG